MAATEAANSFIICSFASHYRRRIGRSSSTASPRSTESLWVSLYGGDHNLDRPRAARRSCQRERQRSDSPTLPVLLTGGEPDSRQDGDSCPPHRAAAAARAAASFRIFAGVFMA